MRTYIRKRNNSRDEHPNFQSFQIICLEPNGWGLHSTYFTEKDRDENFEKLLERSITTIPKRSLFVAMDGFNGQFVQPPITKDDHFIGEQCVEDSLMNMWEEAPRWIPVEEELPPHHHTVLFCTSDVHSPAMLPLQGYYDENNKFWMGYLWSQQRTDVTHWMPLPNPPFRLLKSVSG